MAKAGDGDWLRGARIKAYDPFSEFLRGSEEERRFEVSFLDVARFAGHACLSMAGAFLMARSATRELFPEDEVCVRGDLRIELRGSPSEGATGPISNVLGFITGAWADSGFGGFDGQFKRRGLLRFGVTELPEGAVRFTRISTGRAILVFYRPERAEARVDPGLEFQDRWRLMVRAMLEAPDRVIEIVEVGRAA